MNDEIRKLFEELMEHEKQKISRMSLQEMREYRLHLLAVLAELHRKLRGE